MIKLKQVTERYVRETTAPFTYIDENGEAATSDVTVRFWSINTNDMRESVKEIMETPTGDVRWHTEMLLKRLESLPDIVDEKGKPIKITQEFLDKLDVFNVRSIMQAIEAADAQGPGEKKDVKS